MDLSKYDNSHYDPGAGSFIRIIWYFFNAIVFHSWLFPISSIKCTLLRMFGAQVGNGVVIKPRINIKYPWNIEIGDNVWLGEGSWIDSLDKVRIGTNVCISQDTYILTGNHDYNDKYFGLITNTVDIEDGVWIGAGSIVCPGAKLKTNSILTAGSVFSGESEANGIYRGNPAKMIRARKL